MENELLNLSVENIQQTTTFFNALDTDNDGYVSLYEIKLACQKEADKHIVLNPQEKYIPEWLENLKNEQNFSIMTEISLEKFLELGNNYLELNATEEKFYDLSDGKKSCIFGKLQNEYSEFSRIKQVSSGERWIEYLKTCESFTDSTKLTLSELLFFENKYNITRNWPCM